MMVSAKEVFKSYDSLNVLNGVSLQINEGEVVSIVGASGAGKSTLLHILGSLDVPDKGVISIDGQDPNQLNQKQLAQFRNNKIGFVFQFHHLLPEFTALENICLPGFVNGQKKSVVETNAKELLSFLNLGKRASHKPAQLSGGEQQRVAVGRALINQPKVIFADEPSGNLDSKNAAELHQLFFDLQAEYGQTFVIATHNKSLAMMSNRTITMLDGQITSN